MSNKSVHISASLNKVSRVALLLTQSQRTSTHTLLHKQTQIQANTGLTCTRSCATGACTGPHCNFSSLCVLLSRRCCLTGAHTLLTLCAATQALTYRSVFATHPVCCFPGVDLHEGRCRLLASVASRCMRSAESLATRGSWGRPRGRATHSSACKQIHINTCVAV
jgi:hypothetical protein